MADDFPTEYDAIILGTGLSETVIAAALARVGKSVLHLDRNEYYSSDWATFTFDGVLDWIKANEVQDSDATSDTTNSPCKEDEKVYILPGRSDTVTNIVTKSYFRTKRKENETSETNKEVASEDSQSKPQLPESGPESSSQNEEREKKDEEDTQTMDANKEKDAHHQENIENSPSCNACDNNIPQESVSETDTANNDSEISQENTPPSPSTTTETLPIPTAIKKPPLSKPAINKDMTYEDLEKYFRQFNIDIAPKMLFSRGPLVEAIISANISHYAEFKAVNRILTYLNGNIEDVPCSRSDVFNSKLISAIEKRTLMKFLTFCIDFENHEDEYREYVEKPFVELLQSRRLSPNLQHFVLHSIAMLPPDAETLTGLKKTRSFLHSLGRYGNTPFIWPLYGIGELPQAFCRMCAVFGGLYCLRRSAESVTVDISSNTCTGITSEGQFLKCKWLVMGNSYVPKHWKNGTSKYVSRAVFITDKSLKATEHGSVALMSMPRTNEKSSPITVIELDKTSAACPSGLNVVHLVTDCCVSAEEDLKATAEELLYFPLDDDDRESSKPIVLWSLYFNHASSCEVDGNVPGNVYCTVLPGSSLGFSNAMNQAKHIFQSICGPDEEFLPAIPNPEDIIMDDIPADQGNHSGLVGGPGSEYGDDDIPSNPLPEEEASTVANEGDGSTVEESRQDDGNITASAAEVANKVDSSST